MRGGERLRSPSRGGRQLAALKARKHGAVVAALHVRKDLGPGEEAEAGEVVRAVNSAGAAGAIAVSRR